METQILDRDEIAALLTKMVPRGLEPRTLRLFAVRSNQLSYRRIATEARGTIHHFFC